VLGLVTVGGFVPPRSSATAGECHTPLLQLDRRRRRHRGVGPVIVLLFITQPAITLIQRFGGRDNDVLHGHKGWEGRGHVDQFQRGDLRFTRIHPLTMRAALVRFRMLASTIDQVVTSA
jgi:hypothetical protein